MTVNSNLTRRVNHMIYGWCEHHGYSPGPPGICSDGSEQVAMWEKQEDDSAERINTYKQETPGGNHHVPLSSPEPN